MGNMQFLGRQYKKNMGQDFLDMKLPTLYRVNRKNRN